MPSTVYKLRITTPDGGKWLACRDPSRVGPMRTKDPDRAHSWESPAALEEWLDAIPDVLPSKDGKPRSGRAWMTGLTLECVEFEISAKRTIPLKCRLPQGALS